MVNKTRRLTSKKAKRMIKFIDLKLAWINYRLGENYGGGFRSQKPKEKEPKTPKGWIFGMEGYGAVKFFLEDYFKDELEEKPEENKE